MLKYLVLECIETDNTYVKFRIKHQSHRYDKFGKPTGEHVILSNYFVCKNGMSLSSKGGPQLSATMFFTKGLIDESDNRVLECTQNKWKMIKDAVQEYNDYFGYKGVSVVNEIQCTPIPKEMFTL